MAKKVVDENKDSKQKKAPTPKKTTRAKSNKKTGKSSDERAVTVSSAVSSSKRRSKEEIAAERAAKAQRKLEREQKKAALAAKRAAREAKKAEREAKLQAKANAAKAKESEKAEAAEVQKVIDGLKVDLKKYCAPIPMTTKEKEHIKKIISNPDTRWTMMSQHYAKSDFAILEHRVNEMVIKVDDVYYFYNKATDKGINFGSVFETWLDTAKKTPWTDPAPEVKVNIVEQAPAPKVTDEQKKAILKKMRGKR